MSLLGGEAPILITPLSRRPMGGEQRDEDQSELAAWRILPPLSRGLPPGEERSPFMSRHGEEGEGGGGEWSLAILPLEP